jgi:signal transduction histidine kinase
VLTNLVHNAVKFTPEQGEIRITAGHTDNNQIFFEVADTGVGISTLDLPRIFDRFFKGSSHRPNEGGSGLGLAIAKRIVEAHQGSISVSSTIGVGTTFRVVLPIQPSLQDMSILIKLPQTNFQQLPN